MKHYVIDIDLDSFDGYWDELGWFSRNIPAETFMYIVSEVIGVIYTRGRVTSKYHALVPDTDPRHVEYRVALSKLYKVVETIVGSVTGKDDLIMAIVYLREKKLVKLTIADVRDNSTLAEFSYWLGIKEREGEYVSQEVHRLVDEFKELGRQAIMDEFVSPYGV